MSADVPLIRDLLARVIDWPGASPAARQMASNMWHDLADPDRAAPGQLGAAMARLTGELRRCRYSRDRGIAAAVDDLRARLAGDGSPPWDPATHDTFAARTRAACHAAGLDL
jgi:hypothetical protein